MVYVHNSKSAAKLLFDKNYQLFLNFHHHTDQAEKSIFYLNNKLHALVKNFSSKSAFHYLDVGCGFGNITLPIIKTIEKYHPIKTVALDPSSQLLSIFEEQIQDENIDLVCSMWEEWHPDTCFNFISSLHTFYYIDDWEWAIQKMMATLDQGGMLCIALRANDSICRFRDYFYKKIHLDGRQERNCDELCEFLKRLNIHYKIDYIDSLLDIKGILIQNEKGQELIEFILRQPYAKLLSMKDEIISYLKEIQQNGYVIQRNGYIWISN